MACNKWEELGLLYSSNELDEVQVKDFESHMNSCDECKSEHETYNKERKLLFTPAVLGDTPSSEVDKEILRVCSCVQKRVTHVPFLSLFLKRSIYSVSFFILGFVVVGYFVLNMENAKKNTQRVLLESQSNDTAALNSASGIAQAPAEASAQTDSAILDSTRDNIYYSKTRGNLDINGVYPVDLKEK